MLANRLRCGLVLLTTVLGMAATLKGDQPAGLRQTPLAPADSLQLIELLDGNQARLLAHEPQVVDPVEVAFDDAGRMWVIEMRDYPFATGEQPRGQIVVLSDNDGDGEYESSQVFADHLDMPTGLALWKEGVVATVAGQLIYLTDSDGDGRAEHTQIWLEGFSKDNEQLRANHPRLGPDGWWYIACGLRGGAVQLGPELRGEDPAAPLDIGSRDVRFHLANKTIELVTGPAQFGLTFDGLGQRIFCSNRNPATQVMFEQADLVGNPLAGLAPSVVDVVPAGESSRVYPLVNAWVTSHLHSGQFTAACGVFARGVDDGRTDIFTCEPTGSLVHRQRSKRSGARLVPDAEQQVPEGREWLASRDAWFRPVNVTVAPDGSMVIVDMHRAVIEHPAWVPEELKQRPDERWGDQAGRIVSIGPQVQLSDVWRELRDRPLRTREDAELVELIGSDNPWLRQTSRRLLLQRAATGDESPAGAAVVSNSNIDALQQMVADTGLTPDARCAALRLTVLLAVSSASETTLATDAAATDAADANRSPIAMAPLLAADLSQTGQSELAMVALRLSRQYPHTLSVHPDELLKLASGSAEAGVRFEAWLCLGSQVGSDSWQATPADLDEVAQAWAQDGDPYLLMAAASGLRDQPEQLLHSWLSTLAQSPVITEAAVAQVPQIARGLMAATLRKTESSQGSGSADAAESLKPLVEQIAQLLSESGLAKSLSTKGVAPLAALECLQPIVKQPKLRSLVELSTWKQLAKLVENDSLPLHLRVAAIALLADSPQSDTPQRLAQMVAQATDPELTGPLLQAWCAVGGDAPNSVLLDRLASASPQLQRVLLPLIAASGKRLEGLAQQLDSGQLTPGQFGVAELTKLVDRASGETKAKLQQQLSRISNSNRAQVVEQYKSCLELEPDVPRGAELFRKHCASCHRVGDIGVDVGPNISDSRTKKPLELLTAILDPNLAIDNNFFRFIVLTEDGRVIEGIIAEETADALIIRGQDDRRELIRREDIATMKATGVSLMPEGLEAQIDPQAMADLIGFIKGWRYLDGAVPVN
ncbi:MAG: c-type cytochrome [Pirellulaceae bacterium]|nr:c-type cytochrome [Pirellulaceae bacterium]